MGRNLSISKGKKIMKLTIIDLEVEDKTGEPEQVATIHKDGIIDAQDSMIEEDIRNTLGPNREVGYRYSERRMQNGNEVIAECQTLIEPGEQGYLAVVSEVLPYPYGVDWDKTDESELQYPVLENNDE